MGPRPGHLLAVGFRWHLLGLWLPTCLTQVGSGALGAMAKQRMLPVLQLQGGAAHKGI